MAPEKGSGRCDMYSKKHKIDFLKSDYAGNAIGGDHSFKGETYQKGLKEHLDILEPFPLNHFPRENDSTRSQFTPNL